MYRYHLLMITLTDTAAVKVKQLLEAEGATELALRVAVRPGGCSGFSYEMYFDGDVASDDQTLTFGDVRVVVDPASAQLLEGASLDYNGWRRNCCRCVGVHLGMNENCSVAEASVSTQ